MARIAVLALVLLSVPGCGGDDADSPKASTTTTAKRAAAERFGYIRSVSTAGPTATLAFDQAEFLIGDEAQRAAEEDGAIPPGEPVPNDYYVRNPDTSTETLHVAADAEITARRCSLCRKGQPGNVDDFLASFTRKGQTYADPYRGAESQYWLTIADATVVAIDEQYVP
jgi:hypothetical protein